MNPFTVILTPEAQRDVLRLDATVQTRILGRIEWIGANAELIRHQMMQGDEWRGCFKYRVGDYRIIYQMDPSAKKLTVLKAGHRREVYE
ncbi:MAG: type II toxin-antitoxin system RelE/ParE family toxin [Chloroflexi bacterium]|nr:type II toxin-antitoxin system RelE/ParE family toxin [Chloroflexota bacterium]